MVFHRPEDYLEVVSLKIENTNKTILPGSLFFITVGCKKELLEDPVIARESINFVMSCSRTWLILQYGQEHVPSLDKIKPLYAEWYSPRFPDLNPNEFGAKSLEELGLKSNTDWSYFYTSWDALNTPYGGKRLNLWIRRKGTQ